MKSKFSKFISPKKEDDDQDIAEKENDENEEESELEDSGPSIASGKKNKIIILAVASIFVSVILYFFFFKNSDQKTEAETIKPVAAPEIKIVAPSEDGKSPFEIELPKEEEISTSNTEEILEKPPVPEIPALPEDLKIDQNVFAPPAQIENTNPQIPTIQPNQPLLPTQNNQINNQVVAANNLETPTQKEEKINSRYAPIVVFSSGGSSPSRSVGYDDNIVNLKEDPIAKLDKSIVGVKTTFVGDRHLSITQGKLITAVLETAINTEIPGSVRGVVSRDVYAEAGNNVLIPKGSRLYGSYSSQVVRGQGRVEISWSRLIRPDGVDLSISFNASDQFGRSGIAGNIDNKYGSVIAGSLLTSILAIGSAAAANTILGDGQDVSTTVSNGAVTTTGGAATQAIADVSGAIINTANQIVGNHLNTNPVITIPQGTKITVIVNSDMNLPPLAAGY
jgi:type IV secretion system protein VirB10